MMGSTSEDSALAGTDWLDGGGGVIIVEHKISSFFIRKHMSYHGWYFVADFLIYQRILDFMQLILIDVRRVSYKRE